MGPKKRKYIKKSKRLSVKEAKPKIRRGDKKPPGKRECPECKALVGIRKFECQ